MERPGSGKRSARGRLAACAPPATGDASRGPTPAVARTPPRAVGSGGGDAARPCWHVYLLRCRDGSLYAGIATDVQRRFSEHASGRGARYTRAHPPERVLATRAYPDRSSALRAEHRLKRQPSARKLAWLLAADAQD